MHWIYYMMMANRVEAVANFKVFVYGTLKPNFSNYGVAEPWVISAIEARVYGKLFDLPAGYPALTVGGDIVHGYLLGFVDEQALADLDRLEDYSEDGPLEQCLYMRESIEVYDSTMNSLGICWVYRMQPDSPRLIGGTHVPSGNWKPSNM